MLKRVNGFTLFLYKNNNNDSHHGEYMSKNKNMWDIIKKKINSSLDWYGKNQKFVWIIGAVIMIAWGAYDTGNIVAMKNFEDNVGEAKGQISISEFESKIKQNPGGTLYIEENDVKYQDNNDQVVAIKNFKEEVNQNILNEIKNNNISVKGKIEINVIRHIMNSKEIILSIVLDFLIKLAGFAFYMIVGLFIFKQIRQSKLAGGAGGKRFKKIEGKLKPLVKIDDVAGYESTKKEIVEIVEYLREPEKFHKTGARPPKGILLYGPPGNGKTLIAKAIAGEAEANFLEQVASSFVQLYVGAGALAVTQLFEEARKIKPCVIFIDEIDALGGSRSGMNSSDERLQAVNALLAEMDGFADNDGIVVIAATNRLEQMDEALIRPGRFDRKVEVPLPNKNDRLEILKFHAKKIPQMSADLNFWAEQTKRFSAAELAALVNEAAIESTRQNKIIVTDEEFSLARDRTMIGVKSDGINASERDKKFTSYHELGHAIVRIIGGGRIEKVSIHPRGMALGVTVSMSEEETFLQTEEELFEELKVLMGGRAAEYVFCKQITGGAADDMEKASEIAREAVRKYGFDKFGPYVPKYDLMLKEAESQAATWLKKAYEEALKIMENNKEAMEELFILLKENQEVKGEKIEQVLRKYQK